MRLMTLVAALPLALAAGAAGAAAGVVSANEVVDENSALLPSGREDRIVGLWVASVAIGPCGGPAAVNFKAFDTFHVGGTLSDTNAASITTRGPGHGVWTHYGRGVYDSRTQYFRFLANGAPDGVQDIFQEIILDARGRRYESVVRARTLNVDGSLRSEACGTSTAERIPVK